MYRTILVPLDGSSRAERVLPHVEELAGRLESQVIFLHVPEHSTIMPGMDWGDIDPAEAIRQHDEDNRRREEEIAHYLDSWVGEFREKGLRGRKLVEPGPVVRTIIDVAQREDADLIAMASHGRTGLPRVFYGSVAAGVLHQVDRPLLVIRATE
jgi:nucleotide-binding universal stress UspA family protein